MVGLVSGCFLCFKLYCCYVSKNRESPLTEDALVLLRKPDVRMCNIPRTFICWAPRTHVYACAHSRHRQFMKSAGQ